MLPMSRPVLRPWRWMAISPSFLPNARATMDSFRLGLRQKHAQRGILPAEECAQFSIDQYDRRAACARQHWQRGLICGVGGNRSNGIALSVTRRVRFYRRNLSLIGSHRCIARPGQQRAVWIRRVGGRQKHDLGSLRFHAQAPQHIDRARHRELRRAEACHKHSPPDHSAFFHGFERRINCRISARNIFGDGCFAQHDSMAHQ